MGLADAGGLAVYGVKVFVAIFTQENLYKILPCVEQLKH
jgi:hypothetical protein